MTNKIKIRLRNDSLVSEMCLYIGAKLFKKQEDFSSTLDHHEEYINLARENVNCRGLQMKHNWSNILNPFPRKFEPILLPFLGHAGKRAMDKYREQTTQDWQNVISLKLV